MSLRHGDHVRNIIISIRGSTGNNFQGNVWIILSEYYKYFNKAFEKPQALRGDGKNDGWVPEDKTYYMIYAPFFQKPNLYKEIQGKFKSDLEGLLDKVYGKGLWAKEIKKAILIVNTMDYGLPADTDRAYETIANQLMLDNGVKFEYDVVNSDWIVERLDELPINILERIEIKLNLHRYTDENIPNFDGLVRTITAISNEAMKTMLTEEKAEYKRVSNPTKISINNLENKKEKIEQIIEKLGIVESVVNSMNQGAASSIKFTQAKQYIINLYDKNKTEFKGEELYNAIIYSLMDMLPLETNENTVDFLVVYIFDKCDIFEKEGKLE